MKHYSLIIAFLFVLTSAKAQHTEAEQLAGKIAQKLTDTLGLQAKQKDSIYSINIQLHQQKQAMRQMHTDINVLSDALQKVENSRDSLYKALLTSQQYVQYQEKKTQLVNNN